MELPMEHTDSSGIFSCFTVNWLDDAHNAQNHHVAAQDATMLSIYDDGNDIDALCFHVRCGQF